MWQTVVLIPKWKGGFQSIGFVKVFWKAVTSLLNLRLTSAITYHNALHGFWAGRGTGTSDLEAKLPPKLTTMREAVLFEIFMHLQKAYDALDQERTL